MACAYNMMCIPSEISKRVEKVGLYFRGHIRGLQVIFLGDISMSY